MLSSCHLGSTLTTDSGLNIYIYIYIYIYIVADTGSAIRNDLQRPLTSGIGVQELRDLKRDLRKGREKVTLVEGDRPSAYVSVQFYKIHLTTSHETGGLSLGNRRCWTTSAFLLYCPGDASSKLNKSSVKL